MNAARRRLLQMLACTLPVPALGQGFAGLGSDADGFAIPQPDPTFRFPADHGAHPEFRIEWWYVTAILDGADGRQYGIQWTLFRSALAPEDRAGWDSPQIWFAHAGLTTPERHFVGETLARGGIGQAGVRTDPFEAWIDDWSLVSRAPPGADAFSALDLRADGPDFAYMLALDAEGPLVFQGQNGFSLKSATGQASYYYAQPFYRVTGQLDLPDGPIGVTGQAWLDREWSSQPLEANQTGWDWFSLQLGGGRCLMLFQLRDAEGRADGYAAGSLVDGDQRLQLTAEDFVLSPGGYWRSPHSDARYPLRWRLEIPGQQLALTVEAMLDDQELNQTFRYWEGAVRATGRWGTEELSANGYLEMTGYDRAQ